MGEFVCDGGWLASWTGGFSSIGRLVVGLEAGRRATVPEGGSCAWSDSPETAVMASIRVLVVDDEPPIRSLVRGYLETEGFEVLESGEGSEAVTVARERSPDVVILDVMLPGLDGVEVCRQIRAFSDAYVLMLTARGEEIDRIVGLTVGADDYLVKPFSPRELVARVKTLLRRPRVGAAAPLPAGLAIDVARRAVAVDGRAIELTALEFDLLAALAREPSTVVRRSALLERVWGVAFVADEHLVDVHIANLRRRLGDDAEQPRFVETIRGVGYRLKEAS